MPPIEGDVDLCEMLEDNSIVEMADLLSLFGVTGKCPVSAVRKKTSPKPPSEI